MFSFIKIRSTCTRRFILDIFGYLVQIHRSVLDVFVLDGFKTSVLDGLRSVLDVRKHLISDTHLVREMPVVMLPSNFELPIARARCPHHR